MAKSRSQYVCQSCGASAPRWFGKCAECGEWNTCVEEIVAPVDQRKSRPGLLSPSEPVSITEVNAEREERQLSRIAEFDRALGGGIVPGSVVLLGGDPGIGKSTLLLQVLAQLADYSVKVLYVSGEESARQVRMRAGRIGAMMEGLLVLPETNLDHIEQQIQKRTPLAVVIDSIQAVYRPEDHLLLDGNGYLLPLLTPAREVARLILQDGDITPDQFSGLCAFIARLSR